MNVDNYRFSIDILHYVIIISNSLYIILMDIFGTEIADNESKASSTEKLCFSFLQVTDQYQEGTDWRREFRREIHGLNYCSRKRTCGTLLSNRR